MKMEVHYAQELEANEIEILRNFEAEIRANWVQHAMSMAILEWTLFIDDAEPARYAILRVRNNQRQILKESLWSLERKNIQKFKDEFIDNAMRYSNENPS